MKDEGRTELTAVGARIRAAREASGLNLHDLALLSGVSAPNLSLIETGKRDLRLTSLFRIAAALRIGVVDLLETHSDGGPAAHDDSGAGYDLEDYT